MGNDNNSRSGDVTLLRWLPVYAWDAATETLSIYCSNALQLRAAMQISRERGLSPAWCREPDGRLLVTARIERLRPGTRVRLPDGTVAYATPDLRVGEVWNGEYRVRQGEQVHYGWRREQLVVTGGVL